MLKLNKVAALSVAAMVAVCPAQVIAQQASAGGTAPKPGSLAKGSGANADTGMLAGASALAVAQI